ncbi:MAG: sensor histidine kinase [Candidatus Geothermincolia bacterium]
MTRRTDLMSLLPGGLRPAGNGSDELRIDYISASRGLKKSILMIYVIGLVTVLAVDIIYNVTGNKSGAIFAMDMVLYNAAAVILGLAVYRVTTRGWLHAYATESALVSITEVSADAVYSIGTDSLIIAWSKGAERIFGFSEKEAIGESVGIVLPDDFLERDLEILEPLLTEGIVTGHRTLGRRKGGEVFPSEVSASLLRTPEGDPASILFVLRDVTRQVALETELHEARDELEIRVEERTAELRDANALLQREVAERVRAEVALKESELHFRSLIENASDVIVVVDHLGRIEYVSPAIARVLGFEPRELDGVNALTLAHPDDLAEVSVQLAEVTARSGVTVSAEFRFRHRDGSYVALEGVGTSFIDDLGNVRVTINARDITERKRNEERIRSLNSELERSVAELQDLNRELEAFSFSVSHDLRAPVRAIGGFAERLVEKHSDCLDEEGRRTVDIISRNARQMDSLIEGLLSFSRLGRKEMSMVEVDMKDLAAAACEEAAGAGVHRAVINIGDLPPARGDPVLLRQVFANLVGNALKFSSLADSPQIEISGEADGLENLYFVRDNGVGFDMAYAERLFGVFQRLHTSDEFEGTGIGLASVQRIIHRHMGRAWAHSRPGEGATFYFALPKN